MRLGRRRGEAGRGVDIADIQRDIEISKMDIGDIQTDIRNSRADPAGIQVARRSRMNLVQFA
jgi:hypothetical protein